MKMILRWLINAFAIYIALRIVPGIHLQSGFGEVWPSILLLALILGLVNALLRPLVVFLTCPLIILTLGLGTLLINTLMFVLTGWIGKQFGWGFTVDGFLPAFLGALVVSVVSLVLSIFIRDGDKKKRRNTG